MTRLGPICCVALVLAGCANSDRADYLAQTDQQAETRLRSEYRADYHGPAFARLAGKVHMAENFRHNAPACEGITHNGYPDADDSAALHRWIELRTAYFLGAEALQIRAAAASEKATPIVHHYVDVMQDGLKRSTALIEDLADRKMTFCQFAEADKALTEQVVAEAAPLHVELVKAAPVPEFAYPPGEP